MIFKSQYISILKNSYNYLGYGFLHYFFSGIGQTFFISLFVLYFSESLQISSNSFNTIYGLATLLSALILPIIGSKLDRYKTTYFSIATGLSLSLFCLAISFSTNPYLMFFALAGLRLCGQGLLPLTGSTSVVRYFNKDRGKAMSITSMGLALSETILPVIAILLISLIGWEWTWRVLALSVLVVFIPLTFFSVKLNDPFQKGKSNGNSKNDMSKNRKDVLRDRRFYLIVPSILLVPFIITGLFLNQHYISDYKHWTPEWIAICFIGFGLCKVATSLIAGPIVDKYSAKRVFPFHLLPLALGLVFLLVGDHKYFALIYLCFAGMSISLMSVTSTPMWIEMYGSDHLASIKSLISTVVVFASAIGPLVLGSLIGDVDKWHISIISIIAVMVAVSFFTYHILNQRRTIGIVRKYRALFKIS